ncbi:MAG: hypothetical protein B7Z47_03170, partial [Chthoniobacter sp. 12-60-6]
MKTVRIFISSPGDVEPERERAQQVIEGLQKRYVGRLTLKTILWEKMPLQPHLSFQEQISRRLASEPTDIAVFILWSRLGSLQDQAFLKPDGTPYRSGTEHELDLMLRSKLESPDGSPHILVYRRDDETSFRERFRHLATDKLQETAEQKQLLNSFIEERFQDASTGNNIRAFHTFEQPPTFAKNLRIHLREILDPLSGLENAEPIWNINEHGSPFQGLSSFDFHHAPIFSGREDEMLEIRQAFREQASSGCAFVLIQGPSGSGKSSLARAGVLPFIVEKEVDHAIKEWRHLMFIPSLLGTNDLFGGFASLLVSVVPEITVLGVTVESLAQHLRTNPAAALDLCVKPALLSAAAAAGNKGEVRLIVLADQLEELFGEGEEVSKKHEPFLLMLEAFAKSNTTWVLATLRSDFFALAQQSESLVRMRRGKGSFEITFPTDDAIRRMVEEPALMAGLTWESEDDLSLANRIIQDARTRGELLPLLAYLLGQLFEMDRAAWRVGADPAFRRLTFKSYRQLGAVEGALNKMAESEFKTLGAEAQEQFANVMRRVTAVSQDDAGRFTRRWANYDELYESAGSFVDAFLKARLFVAKKSEQGEVRVVSVAHEAILTSWPRLNKWLEENKKNLKARTAITADARLWRSNEMDKSFLYSPGLQLDEARSLLKQGFLERDEGLFVEKSIEAAEAGKFAATLAAGEGFYEGWFHLEARHPGVGVDVLRKALASDSAEERKSAALLLGMVPHIEIAGGLEDLVVDDPDDAVRRAAALSLTRRDRTESFQAIQDRLETTGKKGDPLRALACILVAADMETHAPNFDRWFRRLSEATRSKITVQSWRRRSRAAIPVYFAVVIPAMVLAAFSAAAFKWVPGWFNCAYGQAHPSGLMSIFHSAIAATLIGGLSALGLTAYRMVFGREHGGSGSLQPFGAIVFGALFGLLGGLLCTGAIAGVFAAEPLYIMGWIENQYDKPDFTRLLRLIFIENC